ncbi:MAG TPA: metallopeptidase TldD-related protein [Gemmatimonadaceae bacterium]
MSARHVNATAPDDVARLIPREEAERIWEKLRGYARGGGTTDVGMVSWWAGEMRWARNRATMASDRRDVMLGIWRTIAGVQAGVYMNQIDDESLAAAMRAAELAVRLKGGRRLIDLRLKAPSFEFAKPKIWSDATVNLATEARASVARTATELAAARGMHSAGYVEVRAHGGARFSEEYDPLYVTLTQARCSTTVRDVAGTGSGWAGLSSYDWSAIDPHALAERALQKALASRDPVGLEPGRYTVVLEPQAVFELVRAIVQMVERYPAEQSAGPFTLGRDPALGMARSKLGLKVVDERVTIGHDPMDPQLGVLPFTTGNVPQPFRPVKWIDHGVLTALADPQRDYALSTRNENVGVMNSGSFRMSGGNTTVDEMIRTTKRGLLVTRFSSTRVLDADSLLMTGLTRDGLWLIENGAVTKAVKNFRFTESPLLVLNNLEALGVPMPVFNPVENPYDSAGLVPAIVPPIKARDFSFTSLVDAV